MAFDPDAFLLEDEEEPLLNKPNLGSSPVGTFDPDAFLAEETPEDQSIFRQVADIPLGIARGGVTGIKMMTDILGADNPVSKSLAGVEGYMADLMSAQAKEDQQEISRIMKDAEDKGFGEQVKAGIKAFSIAPVDIMSQALGTMAPVLATGLVGSTAKLGALGIRGIQLGVGAGMGAGMIKGEIYNEVKNELINSGTPEEVAEKAAVDAQAYGGKNLDQILLGAGLGAASTLGAEGIITRILTKQGKAATAGIVSRALKGGITEAIPEGIQAAQEQLAKNVALQREGFNVDPSRGIVAAATMEAIAGAPLGGLAGAVESPAKIKTLAEENLEQTNEIARKVAESGAPLTASALQDKAAANLNQDELAKQLDEELSLTAVKPTATPAAIPTKADYVARYSAIAQAAPEELTRAEQSFTNELAAADTEEKRINAQNALDAIKEVKAVGITPAPAKPVTPVTQPPTKYATQEIIQPEGVRQEPQDRVEGETTAETIARDRVFGAEAGQEEGQVDPVVSGLQAVANNTATSEQIASLSMQGLVDIRRGQAIINEDGEGILAQAQAQLPKLTPEERAAEVESTPRPLPTDVLPTETPGATYGRESELFDVFGGVRRRPVQVEEPIISEKPATSELVGAEPAAIVEQAPTIEEDVEPKEQSVDLGDNITADFLGQGDVIIKDADGERVGRFESSEMQNGLQAINVTFLNEDFRGKGIGQKIVKKLRDIYGAIASDVTSDMSRSAKSMWINAGAKIEQIVEGEDIQNRYVLRKELAPTPAPTAIAEASAPVTTPAPAETPAAPVPAITMTEANELGYTQRDPASIRTFKANKLTADSLTKHLEKNGFQDGDVIETPQGTAELYVADTGFAYSWKPKKGRGREGDIKDPVGGVKINPVVMRDPNAPSLSAKVEKTSPPKGYVKKGDLYVYQPTPAAPAETPAAPQRDVTKPEQMTPEEWRLSHDAEIQKVADLRDSKFKKRRAEYESERASLQKKRTATLKRISRLNPNGSTEEIDPSADTASRRIIEDLKSTITDINKRLYDLTPPDQSKLFDEAAKELGYNKEGKTHRAEVIQAVNSNLPVSAAAVDAYGIKLPAGYVKQGDLYFYQPTPAETPAAPVESAIEIARKADFTTAATRDEAGTLGRNIASQDPSLPPMPPAQFEVLESISNLQSRKPYNPDVLTEDAINEARENGFITGKQVGKLKITESGRNQLREWSDQARDRDLAESALRDEIADIAVSQWDAANDPTSAAAIAARAAAPAAEPAGIAEGEKVSNDTTKEWTGRPDMEPGLTGDMMDDMSSWITESWKDQRGKPRFESAEEAWNAYTAYDRSRGVSVPGKRYFTESLYPQLTRTSTLAGIAVGNRVKTKTTPQSYVVEEVLPQSAREAELGEQYYRIKNERTGESQTVEANDIKIVKGKGVRKMAAATRNEEYMRLAQDPEANREQLQRMVDEAAKRAGYATGFYHGTNKEFTAFKAGSMVTQDFEYAAQFGGGKNGKVIPVAVTGTDTATPIGLFEYQDLKPYIESGEIGGVYKLGNSYVLAEPEMIKSADPVTYDDAGNIIPLEERFQATSPDIRRMAEEIRVEEDAQPVPEADRYTFEEAAARAKDFFGGTTPDGLVIVNDTQNPDYQFKAGFDPETNQIILNLAYIPKTDNISDLITHELGHFIYGDPEFQKAFKEFWNSLPEDIKADIDDIIKTFYNEDTGDIQLEEAQVRAFSSLVGMKERAPLWRRVLDAIKNWINSKLKTNLQVTDRGAAAVLAAGIKRFQSGEQIVREMESGVLKIAETAQDAEYLAAVERGDMETAQRMVDEAAKKAGYKVGPVFHGTADNIIAFNENERGRTTGSASAKRGFFFAANKDVAEGYANFARPADLDALKRKYEQLEKRAQRIGTNEAWNDYYEAYSKYEDAEIEYTREDRSLRIVAAYLDLQNPLVHDYKGQDFRDESYDSLIKQAQKEKRDGAIFKNTFDGVGSPGGFQNPMTDVYVVFRPNQIKSADPVTYDDAGNVIPLSQRFRSTSSDIRRMAAPRREQVGGMKIGKAITTPPGITKLTQDVIKAKFFDASTVSEENTRQAYNYIQQFLDKNDNNGNKFAGLVNNVVDDELVSQTQAMIDAGTFTKDEADFEKRMGASLLRVELMNYASRLAAQGDVKMFKLLRKKINNMPSDEYSAGLSAEGRSLNTAKGYTISGYGAFETEQNSNVDRLAAALFGTSKPTPEQREIAQRALDDSEDVEIDSAEDIASDIQKVEGRSGKSIINKIEAAIRSFTDPKKEELLLIFTNLLRSKNVEGITVAYNPTKQNPSQRIKDFIKNNLANYRQTLIDKGASGLESTFWQTMSDQERKPGPLGEIDQAQNNELAKIVQKTLIDLGLKGEPPNTKMTDIEKVASILNKQKLSEEKRVEADQRIVAEIERRRETELKSGAEPEAINAKYDAILGAWNQAMSRQLNMPISDNMLQRLINAELKEQNAKISDLVDEADGKVVAETKQGIVDSIIRKIYGVSKEYETGIEMDENYDGLKVYLEQTLNNMFALQIEKKNAAYARRQAQMSLRNDVNGQAQSIINQLADQLSDTPAFPKKQENQIKTIVQQDLRQKPRMDRKTAWTNQLTAKLIQAGASEAQALTISDLVWRQHEIKAMDRELKELQTAAEKGSLAVIIQRIKDTPLEEQQKPEWMQDVIREYLVEAGLSNQAASTAARLYESVIAERFAEAKQKAFNDVISKSAPWKNYLSRNAKLGKNALEKIQNAIRVGVLDPTQTTEGIIAKENGWSGFSKEQLTRIVQLDDVLADSANDDVTKAEAMSELNKIIVKAKMPVRFRDAISAYYVGQALLGIPTFTVNIASPTFFATRNFVTDVVKYAATDPKNIPVAFQSFINSFRSLYDNSMYAFKSQIYMSGEIEYMQGQNVLSELFDKGKDQWAKGDYANGMFNMLIGATQITGRILSALDQGAIEMMQSQNITRYALEAMKGNTKITKDKRNEIVNLVLTGRRKIKEDLVSSGMASDRAGVLAELKVRSELMLSLSGLGIKEKDVLDSSLNDALQAIGRNRAITIKSLKQETENLRDAGILSGLAIGFLENIAQGASKSSQSQQVFAKMLYGFALVPARVFSTAAWFSPIGFVRLGVDSILKKQGIESRYALSLATELQQKQRFIEAVAGSALLFGLGAMLSSSSDDDEDKFFKIVVTGNGPDYNIDKQYHDSWHKNNKPLSVAISFGKTKTTFNIGRGGEAISIPLLFLGGLDDARIKQKLNQARKSPADFEMIAEALGSAFYGLAQRGPFAAFTKPLFDAKQGDKFVPKLFGQLGFLGKTFVPVLGTSVARNISDFISDPVDKSSIQGAIYSNIPVVGPAIGTKALNAFGQPIRADDWGDRLFKLGVPVVMSFPKNTPENELNQLVLKKGDGPPIPTRTNAQKKFEEPLTDKEFEIYVREYGRVVSDKMFKNRKRLESMDAKTYTKELDKYVNGYSIDGINISGASDAAVRAVKKLRNE